MRKWLADYRVESKLILPDENQEINYTSVDDSYQIIMRNVINANRRNDEALAFQVIVHADDIESAETLALEKARNFLGMLSFVTSHGFRIVRKRFLMDWTPGVERRQAFVYGRDENLDRFPDLRKELFETIGEIETSPNLTALDRALRWYSAGTRSSLMEDQYQYFWFVMEILADIADGAAKVIDKCRICGEGLVCKNCGKTSQHRPFPRQRIDALLMKLNVGAEIRDDLFKIRNGLMHGRSREEIVTSIQERVPDFDFHKAVDILGGTAFMALFNAMKLKQSQMQRLAFGRPDSFVSQTAVIRAYVIMGVQGDPQNPRVEDVILSTITAERVPMPTGEALR